MLAKLREDARTSIALASIFEEEFHAKETELKRDLSTD